MPGYVVVNFFIYSVINAFTPGPGNILALNTVTNYGYKKGRPLFGGIFAGYYVVQMICAIFVFGVSTFLPDVLGIMKYIGAAYILWLAVHIAMSRPISVPRCGFCFCLSLSLRRLELLQLSHGLAWGY